MAIGNVQQFQQALPHHRVRLRVRVMRWHHCHEALLMPRAVLVHILGVEMCMWHPFSKVTRT